MSGVLTRATVIKVAELVGAGEVIVGSFKVEGDDIVVQASSVRVDVGKLEPPVSERGPLTDLFGVFERLAGRLSSGAAAANQAARPRPPLGAFENFIKGLVAENPASQATFLESAIQEWPAFDRARLALWEVRSDQGDHAAALAVASGVQSGARLAGRASFFAAVSELRMQRFDEAFGGFLKLLEHSKSASEGGSTAVDQGAVYNNLAVVQIRRATANGGTATYFLTKATEAEPGNPDYMFNLGYAYLLARDQNGANYWLREMLRRDPTDADAHYLLAAALQAAGSGPEAAREKELARQLSSRYEDIERRPAGNPLPVPRGLERIQTEPDRSRTLQTNQAIVGPAQREQRELATFHLERGRRLFEREQVHGGDVGAAPSHLPVTLRSTGASAHRPDSPASGTPHGSDRRVEDLDLERRQRGCTGRARRRLSEDRRFGRRAPGSGAGARARIPRRKKRSGCWDKSDRSRFSVLSSRFPVRRTREPGTVEPRTGNREP